jgi:benzoate/toluate 1,2-dioxygenase subunit alpha
LSRRLDGIVQDEPENGIFRARRDMFTDEELFELEMKHIWEGNWIYWRTKPDPEPNDYFTTHIGRQPIMITRDKDGQLHALINACSHRGAMLCRHKRQNKKTFTCPFHGWTFNNTGKLLKVKDPNGAGYPEQFNKNGSHDLTAWRASSPIAASSSGRSTPMSSRCRSISARRVMIDMVVDQSDEGLEVLRGGSTYTYQGNWKLQAENGADGYHVSAVHWNYVATTSHRAEEGKEDKIKASTPPSGTSSAAGSIPSTTATCCSGPNGPTRPTAPATRVLRNGPRSTARRRPTGWSASCATSASIRTSS